MSARWKVIVLFSLILVLLSGTCCHFALEMLQLLMRSGLLGKPVSSTSKNQISSFPFALRTRVSVCACVHMCWCCCYPHSTFYVVLCKTLRAFKDWYCRNNYCCYDYYNFGFLFPRKASCNRAHWLIPNEGKISTEFCPFLNFKCCGSFNVSTVVGPQVFSFLIM